MIRNLFKRVTAGALSALTLLTSAPLAGAVDSGIMPLAEEDNKASAIKATIDTRTSGQTRGSHGSYTRNFQQTGRDVPYLFVKSSVALNLS